MVFELVIKVDDNNSLLVRDKIFQLEMMHAICECESKRIKEEINKFILAQPIEK